MTEAATAIVPKDQQGIMGTMAAKYGMDRARFIETLQKTIMPQGATMEQTAAFAIVATQYDLNPFIREIYAFPARSGGIVPLVSVDGWSTLINRQKQLDGIEFQDHLHEGKLTAITCRLYHKDRNRPVEVTEYMAECTRDTEPWKKWPARMLRHKALIQCARYAFGLAGIYDEDEAERIDEGTERVEPGKVELEAPPQVEQKAPAEPKGFLTMTWGSGTEEGTARVRPDTPATFKALEKAMKPLGTFMPRAGEWIVVKEKVHEVNELAEKFDLEWRETKAA